MKKAGIVFLFLAAFLVWMTPVAGSAQEEGAEKLKQLMENTTPEQRARFQDHWMKKELNLSNDQAAKVGVINLRTARKMQSVFDSDGGKFRKLREVRRAGDEKDNELQNALTGEQFSKYQEKKEEMREKMQQMKK